MGKTKMLMRLLYSRSIEKVQLYAKRFSDFKTLIIYSKISIIQKNGNTKKMWKKQNENSWRIIFELSSTKNDTETLNINDNIIIVANKLNKYFKNVATEIM